MRGIREDFVRNIPPEAQARLAAAFPDVRVLFNAKRKCFQICHREPGLTAAKQKAMANLGLPFAAQTFYGTEGVGVLEEWALIPPDYETLDVERIIRELRVRQAMQQESGLSAAEMAEKAWEKIEKQMADDDAARLDERYGWVPDGRGREVNLFTTYSRPYARPPGKKELAKKAKRLDAVLREGAPA